MTDLTRVLNKPIQQLCMQVMQLMMQSYTLKVRGYIFVLICFDHAWFYHNHYTKPRRNLEQ